MSSTQIKGTASLSYTPNGGAPTTIDLAVPLGIMRDMVPSRRRRSYVWDAEDLMNRRIVSIGSGVREIVWGLRMENDPVALMAWLEDVMLYDTETTYTHVESGTEYPFHFVEIVGGSPDFAEIQPDRQRWGMNEWEVQFRARRIDGGTFDNLLNLVA